MEFEDSGNMSLRTGELEKGPSSTAVKVAKAVDGTGRW
jgi:hypothetical protein